MVCTLYFTNLTDKIPIFSISAHLIFKVSVWSHFSKSTGVHDSHASKYMADFPYLGIAHPTGLHFKCVTERPYKIRKPLLARIFLCTQLSPFLLAPIKCIENWMHLVLPHYYLHISSSWGFRRCKLNIHSNLLRPWVHTSRHSRPHLLRCLVISATYEYSKRRDTRSVC